MGPYFRASFFLLVITSIVAFVELRIALFHDKIKPKIYGLVILSYQILHNGATFGLKVLVEYF